MDPAGVFATSFERDQALIRTRGQWIALGLFLLACLVAAEKGNTYFVFDRGGVAKLSECCRLSFELTPESRDVLTAKADSLKKYSLFNIVIEGHCDERGSAEYNLGLGDQRAAKTKDALVALGVPADKLRTISYGKERPQCTDASEDCYQRNRRAHFSAGQ